MLIRKLIKNRKGGVATWFDYVFAIVVGLVVFLIFFYITQTGTTRIEKEIVAKTGSLKSDIILLSCLKAPLFETPGFGGGEIGGAGAGRAWEVGTGQAEPMPSEGSEGGYGAKKTGAETSANIMPEPYKKTLVADLLNMIKTEEDKGKKEQYKNIFKEKMTFLLDKVYGQDKWEVRVDMNEDSFEFGKISGEAHVSTVTLPPMKGGMIKVNLMTEGPGDELQEKLEPAK